MIQITNLSKDYGKKAALKDVSIHIQDGMFGLLGKNGAGKTTLMKIMATLIIPSSGSCYINGITIKEKKKYAR